MEKKQNKNSAKKIAYNNRWTNERFDRIGIAIPAGGKKRVQDAAAAAGQSVNAYVAQAINERIERDQAQQPRSQPTE